MGVGVPIRCCEGRVGTWAQSRRKGFSGVRGLGKKQPLPVTLAGEPLPAIGGFMLAQPVPELLSEEGPREQYWNGEIEQGAEVGVLLDGLIKWMLAVRALWGRRQEGQAPLAGGCGGWEPSYGSLQTPAGWLRGGRSALPLRTWSTKPAC